jgi:hypothetical protein
LCLLSLFDDPSESVRSSAAKAIAIRSFNRLFINSDDRDDIIVHHREDCSCIAKDLRLEHEDLADENLVYAVSHNPFELLTKSLDEALYTISENTHWQGSIRERDSFGLWAGYIFHHLSDSCPVFNKSQRNAPSEIQISWISEFASKLATRLDAVQAQSAPKEDTEHDFPWTIRQTIMLIVGYILESSNECSFRTGRTFSDLHSAPYCDLGILRIIAPLLEMLRRDPGWDIRVLCLETVARLIGYSGDPQQTRATDQPILSNDNSESCRALSILYRLVRGQSIIGKSDGSDLNPTLKDAVDMHPRLRQLKTAIITFGQRWHIAALYNTDARIESDDGVESEVRIPIKPTEPITGSNVTRTEQVTKQTAKLNAKPGPKDLPVKYTTPRTSKTKIAASPTRNIKSAKATPKSPAPKIVPQSKPKHASRPAKQSPIRHPAASNSKREVSPKRKLSPTKKTQIKQLEDEEARLMSSFLGHLEEFDRKQKLPIPINETYSPSTVNDTNTVHVDPAQSSDFESPGLAWAASMKSNTSDHEKYQISPPQNSISNNISTISQVKETAAKIFNESTKYLEQALASVAVHSTAIVPTDGDTELLTGFEGIQQTQENGQTSLAIPSGTYNMAWRPVVIGLPECDVEPNISTIVEEAPHPLRSKDLMKEHFNERSELLQPYESHRPPYLASSNESVRTIRASDYNQRNNTHVTIQNYPDDVQAGEGLSAFLSIRPRTPGPEQLTSVSQPTSRPNPPEKSDDAVDKILEHIRLLAEQTKIDTNLTDRAVSNVSGSIPNAITKGVLEATSPNMVVSTHEKMDTDRATRYQDSSLQTTPRATQFKSVRIVTEDDLENCDQSKASPFDEQPRSVSMQGAFADSILVSGLPKEIPHEPSTRDWLFHRQAGKSSEAGRSETPLLEQPSNSSVKIEDTKDEMRIDRQLVGETSPKELVEPDEKSAKTVPQEGNISKQYKETDDASMSLDELGDRNSDKKVDLDAFLSSAKSLDFTLHKPLDSPMRTPNVKNNLLRLERTPEVSEDLKERQTRIVGSAFDRQRQKSSANQIMETPSRPSNISNRGLYTGASVFGEGTPNNVQAGLSFGSPQSFAWTLSEIGSPSAPGTAAELSQINTPVPKNAQLAKSNSLLATMSLGMAATGQVASTLVRPKIRAALELILRHLIFSSNQKSIEHPSINYWGLYGTGVNFGSMINLAGLPAMGSLEASLPSANLEEDFDVPQNEALHPMLRSVFRLDMTLMIEFCSLMSMGSLASSCTRPFLSAQEKLHGW